MGGVADRGRFEAPEVDAFIVMAVAQWKAIKPKRLQDDVFRLTALNQLRKTGKKIERDFEKTTQTWDGEKPTFETIISLTDPGPGVVVGPSGSTEGAQKWQWLDEGTEIRYATMSPDWVSKTQPDIVGSRPGQGEVLYVRRDRPRDGIEARNWTLALQKKWKTPFKRDMEKAMRDARIKSGHAI